MKSSLWVERYRPRSIADVVFQDDRQRKQFEAFVANGDIPNLFISGVQGTGKTTVSKALLNDLKIDRADVLRINCSDEKIDALRNKVTSFALTMPIGKFKVVQLEEIDYLSLDGQALLRGLIEQATTCRFIATCNYENKVIPPLKSRFQLFHFKAPDKDKIAERMVAILDAEGVEYDESLLTYIDVGYPDIRQTIQLLQQNTSGTQLMSPKSATATGSDWKFGLLDAVASGDFKSARKLVCESATREEHEDVYTFLYQNIDKLKVGNKDAAVVLIAEALYRHAFIADTEIGLASLFIQLGEL